MKRLLTGLAVISVAAVWMIGSWYFFNSIGVGIQGLSTPAFADVSKTGSKDETPAGDHCWGHCEHWKHHHGMHHLWKKLNLTDAQKKQVHTIIAEEREKIKPLVQQLKAGRDQLNALRNSGPFDEAKVRSIAKGQADTLIELIVVKERMKSRIYGLLTPEQRVKAEQIRESWKSRHEKECKHKD